MPKHPSFFCLLTASLLLASCIDDQRYAPADSFADLNPKPVVSRPAEVNAQHRVLVAIMDSGVDYNHPALRDHIHYELDSQGAITGVGYDFLANDNWAAPYAAVTSHLAPFAPENKKELAKGYLKGAKLYLKFHPEHSAFVFPARDQFGENDEKLFHGTHVAGLASYDNPAIGLLPVRVMPISPDYSQEGEKMQDERIVEGTRYAIAHGARVLNFSINASYAKGGEGGKEKEAQFKKFVSEMRPLMLAHPEVVFVAASGNNSDWTTGRNRASYPCGIQGVPNLLCVAALDREEDLPSFVTIPLINDPVVYVFGENVLSTIPTKMCPFSISFNDLADEKASPEELKGIANHMAEGIRNHCVDHRFDYAFLSGTSMAAPMVSRLAAEQLIANPSLSGREVISAILARSFDKNFGPLATKVLRVPKPSWYGDAAILEKVEKPEGLEGDGSPVHKVAMPPERPYFEFVLPVLRTRN